MTRRAIIIRWALLVAALVSSHAGARADFVETIAGAQPKIVKLMGAGGFRGLEPYQSGMLISADGKILTAWSYVLDTDLVQATLADGRRFSAKLLGADAQREVAVLQIEAEDLPYFDLAQSRGAELGERVLALSNVFGVAAGDEAASVQHGIIAAKTQFAARRGVFEMPYRGPVYVLDAMTNNPGAAGGALIAADGSLLGILGKEVRSAATGAWLNYAVPIEEIMGEIDKLASGQYISAPREEAEKPAQAWSLERLGLDTVPNVVERTPPFVDRVALDSVARRGGLRADDLIVSVNDRLVQSIQALRSELELIDRADPVRLGVMRDNQLIEIRLEEPSSP